MDLALRDTVVLVTGAGQGLGRAIGLAFAREGAHVAFHYHSSADGAEAAAADARALGVKALAVGADLRQDPPVADAVERTERELGPIGMLVNNAAATQRKPFLESTPADWAPQVDVTVTGTVRVTHAVARRMAELLAQYPLRRLGRPDDVTPMVLLLASPLSSWTTGQVVSVNGGYAMA